MKELGSDFQALWKAWEAAVKRVWVTPFGWGWWFPATLVAPERRVGLRGDATRAPTQRPGFGAGEHHSLRAGPAILAIRR
jgi:hypothetical protein